MERYQKKENETSIEYLLRLVSIKMEEKPNDLDWSDIVTFCNLNCHYDSLRKAFQPEYYGAYAIYKYMQEKINNNTFTEDNLLKQLEIKKREIYIETQKLRDIKNEYKTLQREQSRLESFYNKIDEAVDKVLSKKVRTAPNFILPTKNDLGFVSAFADPHYGAIFDIKGFNGETLNKYNPEIFEKRMWEYQKELIDFSKFFNLHELHLVDLGDSIEGKLHLSQLRALKSDIVDDIMNYSEFMVDWLNELSTKKIKINLYTSEGNHSDLRLLTGKKGDFPHENVEKIYNRWLESSFKKINNNNIIIYKNLDGLNYFDVKGYKFLTAHGNKERNIKNSIKDYENTYDIKINYFMVGHLHCKNEFENAKNKETIQVRSLMGLNDYSAKEIKRTADAGAIMFTVHKDCGKKYINDIKFY